MSVGPILEKSGLAPVATVAFLVCPLKADDPPARAEIRLVAPAFRQSSDPT
jgi:hypothetical protein